MNIIESNAENRIAKEFFINYTNTTDVSKKLYPNSFKNKIKNVGIVSRYFSNWKKQGYIEEKEIFKEKISKKGTKYHQKIKAYRLNLNPFFEYFNEKLKLNREKDLPFKNKRLTFIEREILNYIFSFNETRAIIYKYDNLFEGMFNFLEKIFFYNMILSNEGLHVEFAKGFFTKNKKYVKRYRNEEEQFEEFWKTTIKCLDHLTNKIKSVSNFNQRDYFNLIFNSEISKYKHIPFVLEEAYNEKQKEELLKRWSTVFYQNKVPEVTLLMDLEY